MHCAQCRQVLAAINPQELAILLRIVQGKANKQIAQEVHYAEKTIKNALSKLFSKTCTQNRTQLAIFALKHHVVELDELDEGAIWQ